MNLILLNPTKGFDGQPTSLPRAEEFIAVLGKSGIPATACAAESTSTRPDSSATSCPRRSRRAAGGRGKVRGGTGGVTSS